MSLTTSRPIPQFAWPRNLMEFARREGVADQLDPLLEMTHRVFDNAARVEVSLDPDGDLPNLHAITFHVWVRNLTVETIREFENRWYKERRSMFPGPDSCVIVLLPHWAKE